MGAVPGPQCRRRTPPPAARQTPWSRRSPPRGNTRSEPTCRWAARSRTRTIRSSPPVTTRGRPSTTAVVDGPDRTGVAGQWRAPRHFRARGHVPCLNLPVPVAGDGDQAAANDGGGQRPPLLVASGRGCGLPLMLTLSQSPCDDGAVVVRSDGIGATVQRLRRGNPNRATGRQGEPIRSPVARSRTSTASSSAPVTATARPSATAVAVDRTQSAWPIAALIEPARPPVAHSTRHPVPGPATGPSWEPPS
ncbi:hypothetical protein SUDANB176_07329 [Streptomyces sp. enrichment culture]